MSNDNTNVSLYIPFTYENVTKEMIFQTLDALDLGIIAEILFKPSINKKNESGNSVTIHFERWFRNATADKVRQKLISGMSINVNYSPKSYWKVVAFQPKTKPKLPTPTFKQPTITFDDDKFGPRLGLNCHERTHTPQIRRNEPRPRREESRPRRDEPRPRREEPRPRREEPEIMRPMTPTGPPPTKEQFYYIAPDAFDLNTTALQHNGIMIQTKKKVQTTTQQPTTNTEETKETEQPRKKKINIIADDSEDELDEDSIALYGDIN